MKRRTPPPPFFAGVTVLVLRPDELGTEKASFLTYDKIPASLGVLISSMNFPKRSLGPSSFRFGEFMELMSTAPWNFPCGRLVVGAERRSANTCPEDNI